MPDFADPLVRRYLRAAIERTALWNMDMFARLSVLEGAAGRTPGEWVRMGERGFGKAKEHFGPGLAAAWSTSGNTGVYDAAVSSAEKTLRNVPGLDGADLVQEMMVGSSSPRAPSNGNGKTELVGPRRQRIFYSVGETVKKMEGDDRLRSGVIGPSHRHIIADIRRWVQRAALDEIARWKRQRIVPFSPGEPQGLDPLRTRGERMTDEQRENLVLLALRSPGGPGRIVQDVVEELVDRRFPPAQAKIVRAFLAKIGQEKLRSSAEMGRLVKTFDPNKWWTQAFNVVRREIMEEMGVSAQQLTNALGGGAKRVFDFMQKDVGRDPRIIKIVENLGEQIDLLEPGLGSRVARSRVPESLPEHQRPVSPFSSLSNWLEKDEHMEWGTQSSPLAQPSRGPVPLRVASRWIAVKNR
jgi:hypothetical protein